MFSTDVLLAQFQAAGLAYSHAIQPYALKLFFGLFLIDLVVTFVFYTADSAIDPISYLGRFIRQLMGGGFVIAMITYGFQWMSLVIQSFSAIGSAISGLPALSPQSILTTGISLASVLWNSPTASGLVAGTELAILEGVMALVVLGAFTWAAVELLLILVQAYLTIGLGVIVVSFSGNRFTSRASEGYFSTVLRVGVRILFLYAVLGIAMNLANSLDTALVAACHPVTTAVPWITSYWTPPAHIITKICTGTIGLADMANYAAMSIIFVALVCGVPRMAANLVGGPLGHAVEDLAGMVYLTRSITSPLAAIAGAMNRSRSEGVGGQPSQTTMQNFAAKVAADARAHSGSSPSAPLNPFNGQSPGYNMRSGPKPPPPLNPFTGGGQAQLMYIPRQPGAKTRAEAVDITKMQGKK